MPFDSGTASMLLFLSLDLSQTLLEHCEEVLFSEQVHFLVFLLKCHLLIRHQYSPLHHHQSLFRGSYALMTCDSDVLCLYCITFAAMTFLVMASPLA